MRLTLTIAILLPSLLFAQWRSIDEVDSYERAAYGQFIIDPFTNNIWLNAENQVAVIENNGNIRVFTPLTGEISNLAMWNDLQFAFTEDHTYFSMPATGLFSFDNYNEQLEYNLSNTQDFLETISTNEDTVYLGLNPSPFNTFYSYIMYTPSSTVIAEKVRDEIIAKGNQKYERNGDTFLRYSDGPNLSDLSYYLIHWNSSNADADFIGGDMHDQTFQRIGDTLFIAGELGISLIYNYDLLPVNYTPQNTTNMPSANVLEIEFDNQDRLWAVFGDNQDEAFAIARLEGTSWVDFYDENNSPINFNEFYGMEVDTLGNVWVNDEDYLHVLESPNNPEWLDLIEETHSFLSIFPNPTKCEITISYSGQDDIDKIDLINLSGKIIRTYLPSKKISLDVDSGAYLLRIRRNNEILDTKKVIVE